MKAKNLFLTILIGVFAVVLVACGTNDAFEASDLSTYRDVHGESNFYSVGMDEALALVQSDDFNGVLYFGFPGCPWCQAAVPVLVEASNMTNTPVHYVSRTHDLREGEWLEWDAEMAWWINDQFPLEWVNENLQTLQEGDTPYRPNIFVPFVVHVRNGVIVEAHRGTYDGHARMDDVEGRPAYPFTEEEHAELLNTYLRILNGVTPDGGCGRPSAEIDDAEDCS